MLSKITTRLIAHPKRSLVALLAILFVLATLGTQVAIDPSFSSLISQEGEFNSNARALESAFGTNSAFEIVYLLDRQATSPSRISEFTTQNLNDSVSTLTQLLSESQYVVSVRPLEISSSNRQAKVVVSVFEPNVAGGGLLVKQELESLVSQVSSPVGSYIEVTGFPVILDRVNTLLIGDNLTTVLLTSLLVFLVLFWYFQSFRLASIGVLSPLASLAVLAGIMVFLSLDITLTLAAVGVIVVGIGADYSIHVITAYTRYLRENNTPTQSIVAALDELEPALTASFLTTAAGFAALMIGVSPSSQAQGQVLVVAITIIFVITMLLLPLLLFMFVKTPPSGGRQAISFIDSVFAKLAKQQSNHPVRVLVLLFVATIFFAFGASQVGFSTSNSNWIPDNDPVAVTFSETTTAFGDSQTISIVLQSQRGDLRNVQTVRDIQALESRLQGISGVVRVQSPFSDVSLEQSAITQTALQRQDAFNQDFTLTTIRVVVEGLLVDESGDSFLLEELNDILAISPIYQTSTSLFGDLVRFSELGESLQQDAALTTGVGLLLVFVVASLLYMSFAVGTVALIPIVVAVIWAVGMKGFFGIPFTSLSTGIVSLVLGIGVDFSIHLVNSINYSLKKTQDIRLAIKQALQTTGGAIFLSSLTTFFGFLALTFATLLGTQRLGWSLAISIVAVFAVSVVLVPTIMVLRYKTLNQRA